MKNTYQCKSCAAKFSKIIDLDYHWLDCNKNTQTQEDMDYTWLNEQIRNLSATTQTEKNEILKKKDVIAQPTKYNNENKNITDTKIKNITPSHSKKLKNNTSAIKKISRKKSKITIYNLQGGKVIDDTPTIEFGKADGAIIKRTYNGGTSIRYEQSICSCNGDNDRCIRCDGTGYYAKKIIEKYENNKTKNSELNKIPENYPSTSENKFSNDSRGGIYGIRERGRFGSNPLHDDHD